MNHAARSLISWLLLPGAVCAGAAAFGAEAMMPPNGKGPVQVAQTIPDAQTLFGEGRYLYGLMCASCHGSAGEGGYGVRLRGNEMLRAADHIVTQIFLGTDDDISPPLYDQLSDRDIAGIATYLRHAWGNNFGPPVLPGDVAALR